MKWSDIVISQNKFQNDKLLQNYKRKSVILYQGFPITNKTPPKDFILWVGRASEENIQKQADNRTGIPQYGPASRCSRPFRAVH